MDYSQIRGFNYQPTWGSSGLEIWQNFNLHRMGHELAVGKFHFPKINAIRLWLCHDAWLRNRPLYQRNFDGALALSAKFGLKVMPVLFNRWHDGVIDYGGIYADHFLPGAAHWLQLNDHLGDFVKTLATEHANDERIFAWDLCNEPFSYGSNPLPQLVEAELAWLKRMYDKVKEAGAVAPVTLGIHQGGGREAMAKIEMICDVLSIHPYWTEESPPQNKESFEHSLDRYAEFAREVNKPLIATETCWGSVDDARRVEIIRYTLTELKKRNIGWLAYGLHHGPIADLHRAEFGPLTLPGNLSFIEADGTLRPGHEVFNEI